MIELEIKMEGNTLRIELTDEERQALARGQELQIPKDNGMVVLAGRPDAETWKPAFNAFDQVVEGGSARTFSEMFPQMVRRKPSENSPDPAEPEPLADEPPAATTRKMVADPCPGIPISCKRCRRPLTNPTSKSRGLGPICAAREIIGGMEMGMEDKLSQLHQLLAEAEAGGEDTSGIKALIAQMEESNIPPDPFLAPKQVAEVAGDWVDQVFREIFPRIMPGYEAREPQVQLSKEVAAALACGEHLAAEAGTGTGKSLAYLVPAVKWAVDKCRPVVITTGTIALQEQLINKDVPFLQKALADVLPFRAALVKGKGNYLCKLKAEDEYQKQGLIPDPEWPRLVEWMRTTETGDKSTIPGWIPPPELWSRVNVDDGCLKRECPFYNSCHLYEAKRAAKDANILVCNHSLYMADVQVRMESGDGASILPPHAAVVFDEAHHIEDVASESFGADLSQFKVPAVMKELRRIAHPDLPHKEMDWAVRVNEDLFSIFPAIQPRVDKQALRRLDDWDNIRSAMLNLAGALKEIPQKLDQIDFRHSDEKTRKRAGSIGERIKILYYTLHDIAEDDPEWVDTVEIDWSRDKPKVTIKRSPISVAGLLREYIWTPIWSAACLSATISSGQSFGYFKRQVGLDESPKPVRELIVESPFDFQAQSMLYVPRGIPDPGNENYGTAIQPVIADLIGKTNGRAFILFTSYRQMQAAYKVLAPQFQAQGFTVFKQGDMGRSELVAEFKRDVHSVLFATASFWEGVDVQGEALSCVIIDKIPFDAVGDPLLEARQKAIDAGGGNAFMEFSVPRAVIKLKQGVGRLIRTRSDRGIVAILDPRLRTKPYGRVFLKSLPPMREIFYLDDVPAFLAGGEKS